ncbi:mannosyltransferase [Coemansia sp. RSA 990]|nr:mannosyltransferase [Coemansia sp. RSA 990]
MKAEIRRRHPEQLPSFQPENASGKRIAVLVLGDIGRSPRMQYHALSLAQAGHHVDLIGYAGTQPIEAIRSHARITVWHVAIPRQLSVASRTMLLVLGPIKVMYQILLLLWLLLVSIQKPRYILVQNPPAIPTLFVAQLCAWLTGARLVIDWHNYGYTILGMKVGMSHPAVSLAQRGQLVVLYDRAPRHFKRLQLNELWQRLLQDPQLKPLRLMSAGNKALLTERSEDGTIAMRQARPMLIVSSTSWTADEDFSILLDALKRYSKQASDASDGSLPPLAVLITGKGPLRKHYEQEISRLQLQNVGIATAWLSAEDYPLLLGSADLGISLHTSSSGLDLPMKVVDMLGCGTPVCAYRFACIDELVTPANGLVFSSAEELAQQIEQLAISQRSTSAGLYSKLIQGAAEFRNVDWETNYKRVLDLL